LDVLRRPLSSAIFFPDSPVQQSYSFVPMFFFPCPRTFAVKTSWFKYRLDTSLIHLRIASVHSVPASFLPFFEQAWFPLTSCVAIARFSPKGYFLAVCDLALGLRHEFLSCTERGIPARLLPQSLCDFRFLTDAEKVCLPGLSIVSQRARCPFALPLPRSHAFFRSHEPLLVCPLTLSASSAFALTKTAYSPRVLTARNF